MKRYICRFRASVRRSKEKNGFGRFKDGLIAISPLVGNDQGLKTTLVAPDV